MKEEWKDVPGYEGLYQVSDLGRVRSLDRSVPHPWCPWARPKFIKGSIQNLRKGVYQEIGLRKNGKVVFFLVHRLVLLTFAGPCPEGMETRHYPDNDPYNNRLNNLQWATKKTNASDKIIHKTLYNGSRQWCAILTPEDVKSIREEYDRGGVSYSDIAQRFGVEPSTIGSAIRRKTWKHVE